MEPILTSVLGGLVSKILGHLIEPWIERHKSLANVKTAIDGISKQFSVDPPAGMLQYVKREFKNLFDLDALFSEYTARLERFIDQFEYLPENLDTYRQNALMIPADRDAILQSLRSFHVEGLDQIKIGWNKVLDEIENIAYSAHPLMPGVEYRRWKPLRSVLAPLSTYKFRNISERMTRGRLEPEPFRSDGPWIPDLETIAGSDRDWVYVPDVARQMRAYLSNEQQQLFIKGPPASGKTVITRWIANDMRGDFNERIYYLDFADMGREELHSVIEKLDGTYTDLDQMRHGRRRVLLVYENIHAIGSDSSWLKKVIIALNKHVSFIMTTRDEKEDFDWIPDSCVGKMLNIFGDPKSSSSWHDLPRVIVAGTLKKLNSKRTLKKLPPVYLSYDLMDNLWIMGWLLRSSVGQLADDGNDANQIKKCIDDYYGRKYQGHKNDVILLLMVLSTTSKHEAFMEGEFIKSNEVKSILGADEQWTIDENLRILADDHELSVSEYSDPVRQFSVHKAYKIPHSALAEILLRYYATESTRDMLRRILECYCKKGRYVDDRLGQRLWDEKSHECALDCFKLVETEAEVVRSFLDTFRFFKMKAEKGHVTEIEIDNPQDQQSMKEEIENLERGKTFADTFHDQEQILERIAPCLEKISSFKHLTGTS